MITETPAAVKQMRVGLLVIAAQFIIPALSYIVDPDAAIATVQRVNAWLGGVGVWPEGGHLWHMLAVSNVMTLGALCLLIRSDVVRFLPALPGLLFLKAFSAVYALAIGLSHHLPVFVGVFVLDGTTTLLMAALSLRAAHALAKDQTAPWWARWVLVDPGAIEDRVARLTAGELAPRSPALPGAPTLWQLVLGSLRMWRRILFRSETIGTCRGRAVRSTWRARVFAWRALRLPVLLWERAVVPLDPTGLASSTEQILRHLLAAHHDGAQLLYDLELLSLHDRERGLERLRAVAASVVDGTHPRAAWLRDLCVFEGYHEDLLHAVERTLAGAPVDPALLDDADATFTGFLRWCAQQPRALRSL